MSHPILRGLGLRNSEWAWQDLSDQKLRWGCCPSRESHDRFPQSPAPPHGLRYPRHWFHFLLSISVSVFSVRKKTVGFMRLSSVLDSSVDAVTDIMPYDPPNSFERSNYHSHFADEISEVQSTTDPTSHCESSRARSQTLRWYCQLSYGMS